MMMVISAATVVIVSAYCFFILKPQAMGIISVIGKLAKVSGDLRVATADISRIESMKKAVADYSKKVAQYERSLPTEEGIPALLEGLSDMANKANMRIVGITPIDKKENKAEVRVYREIPIAISAKSGYHELGEFLSELENNDRFMKVTDMQIKSDSTSLKKHNVELIVVTYVLLGAK